MAKRNQQTSAMETALLDGQLNAYSAAIRVSNAVGSFHRRVGNWPIYAAATGSALAMATGASASILYSGIQNASVTAPLSGNAVQPINLDGAGHVFNLKAGAGVSSSTINAPGTAFGIVSVQAVNQVEVFVSANTQLVKNFAGGIMVSSLAGLQKNNAEVVKRAFSTGFSIGDFQSGVPSFAGLAIHIGAATEYGWIQLEFSNGLNGLPGTLTAIDWAIQQTGDVGILTGQTADAAAPEPGTMALGLLASGAAGIMLWKRRRKQLAVA